jgi:hypothetical protein
MNANPDFQAPHLYVPRSTHLGSEEQFYPNQYYMPESSEQQEEYYDEQEDSEAQYVAGEEEPSMNNTSRFAMSQEGRYRHPQYNQNSSHNFQDQSSMITPNMSQGGKKLQN